jgi:glutathione S-transferase
MKLYYSPYTSAFRPRWLLEEIGTPFELVRKTLSPEDIKTPEYLKIHPLGQVPALVDGDLTLIESAAICLYLAEKDPEHRLVPTDPKQRALYLQWVFYAMGALNGAIHPVYIRWFMAAPDQKANACTDADRAELQRLLKPLASAFASGPFLLGNQLTTADIVVGGVLKWADLCGQLQGATAAEEYFKRLSARPAYQRALA